MHCRSGATPFESIRTAEGWWQWAQSDLLDLLYWDKWYNGQPRQDASQTVGNSQLVGRVSVRQKRVQSSPCGLPGVLSHMFTSCYHGYSSSPSQRSWLHTSNRTWSYKETDQTGSSCVHGRFADYDGSGYQVFLPTTRKDAELLLQELQDYEWLDRHSRIVLVEFILFHAPSNLFRYILFIPNVYTSV